MIFFIFVSKNVSVNIYESQFVEIRKINWVRLKLNVRCFEILKIQVRLRWLFRSSQAFQGVFDRRLALGTAENGPFKLWDRNTGIRVTNFWRRKVVKVTNRFCRNVGVRRRLWENRDEWQGGSPLSTSFSNQINSGISIFMQIARIDRRRISQDQSSAAFCGNCVIACYCMLLRFLKFEVIST